MALPEEILDELLSAHLDDALSGDERARVEQMLSDDPAISQRFEQLQRNREAFRQAVFASPKLPDGFADTIVQAAIKQAQSDQMSADHPLQLAAHNSRVRRQAAEHSNGSFSKPRLVAIVSGLAASALFVGFLVQKYSGDQSDHQIAQSPVQRPIEESVAVVEPTEPVTKPDSPEIAPLVNPATRVAVAPSPPNDAEAIVTDVPNVEPEATQPMLAESDNSVKPPKAGDAAPPESTPKLVLAAPLNTLLVIAVTQTETGRNNDAFDQALAKVQIAVSEERLIDDKLARAVTKESDGKNLNGPTQRVVLLEAPAKQLDLLVNRLVADRDGFTSVGFSLISAEFDAPLMNSVNGVRTVDPTKIRHEGNSFPIVSQSEDVFGAWSGQLGDRGFAPMQTPEDAKNVSFMVPKTGPDQMANILFLIR